jgi:DNA polymerase-3 subunit delta
MIIKYQALGSHLKQKIHPIYVLQGSDHYLVQDAADKIKKVWRDRAQTDEKIIYLNTSADWASLIEEANSYSLFSEQVLLDARFEKKSIDAASKLLFNQYLKNVNLKCLVLLQVSAVPIKQLEWLSNNTQVTLIQVFPFDKSSLINWISSQLTQRSIKHLSQITTLIYQYTQGNMLACAQLIEKLALINSGTEPLTLKDVSEHLVDQCEYQLYELADACLSAHTEKALHLLKQAFNNRTEPTLILWLITQEVRHLIQLTHLIKQNLSLSSACAQQKIWPKRSPLYKDALSRLSLDQLYKLIMECGQIDNLIKSNKVNLVWEGFQTIALSLCGYRNLS